MTGTRFRTGTIHTSQTLIQCFRGFAKLLTVQVEVIATVEETQAIGAGATTDSTGQNTVKNTVVDVGDRASVGLLIAAGDDGVIATLGVGLLEGDVPGEGVGNVAGRRAAAGEGHGGGSEEESSGEELHFDGLDDKHVK